MCKKFNSWINYFSIKMGFDFLGFLVLKDAFDIWD